MNDRVQQIVQEHLQQEIIKGTQITGRGHVNEIYVVTTRFAKYIVRIDLSEATTDRFEKEAWCINEAAKFEVPGATVLGVGIKAGHPYMLMTYIDGKNGDEAAILKKTKYGMRSENMPGKYTQFL